MAVGDTNYITDGNIQVIGRLMDNILSFIAQMFGGLASFGNVMGILIGLAFVLGLVLVATGKIKIGNILKF